MEDETTSCVGGGGVSTPSSSYANERNLVQNTAEWEVGRRGRLGIRLGASEAAAACGVSKYVTPLTLYQAILGGWHKEENEITQYGHVAEPILCEYYEQFTGYRCESTGIWAHHDAALADYFACSPDRLVHTHRRRQAGVQQPEGLLEIKNRWYPTMFLEENGLANGGYYEVPGEHMTQTMYQQWCTAKPWVDLVSGVLQHDNDDAAAAVPGALLAFRAVRVMRSHEFIEEWMVPRLMFFKECLERRREPPRDLWQTWFPGWGDVKDVREVKRRLPKHCQRIPSWRVCLRDPLLCAFQELEATEAEEKSQDFLA